MKYKHVLALLLLTIITLTGCNSNENKNVKGTENTAFAINDSEAAGEGMAEAEADIEGERTAVTGDEAEGESAKVTETVVTEEAAEAAGTEDLGTEASGAATEGTKGTGTDMLSPASPPDITISVNGLSLDYVARATNWDGEQNVFTKDDAYGEIIQKDEFLPTFNVGGIGETTERRITIDFGKYIPDSVQIYDYLLDDFGNTKFNFIPKLEVEYPENSELELPLNQNMALALSSDSRDYVKDWLRLFRFVCKWGTQECTYAFLINTGNTEELTEISDHDFLDSEGTYSMLSSTLGIGLTLDPTNLPKHYIVEWQISDGSIIILNKNAISDSYGPHGYSETHHGFPMTTDTDTVIWHPIWMPTIYKTEDISIKAYIYEEEEDKRPVAYSEITIENNKGIYQKKIN